MFKNFFYKSTSFFLVSSYSYSLDKHNNVITNKQKGGEAKKGEPIFSREDVSFRNGKNGSRNWVTYRDGVYDITNFIKKHPGGESLILSSSGGAVDNFWDYWASHHSSKKVSSLLDSMRIGKLSDYDYSEDESENNMYTNEDKRNSQLIPYSYQPFEAETPKHELSLKEYTDSSLFFVRNHAPVPYVDDLDTHQIFFIDEFGTERRRANPKELIQKFGTKEITSVLQCAGNRAKESIEKNGSSSKMIGKPSENVDYGLVGNAKWSGILLEKVLLDVYPELNNIQLSELEKKHLVLYGADDYVSSVPLKKIIGDKSRKNNCLLATHMNGQSLSLDHGFPVRALLPGIVGARSVKWLIKLEIRNEESSSCWNQYFYRNNNQPCMEIPLNSLITDVKNKNKTITINGIAYGDGEQITDIELSFDKGLHWEKINTTNKKDNNSYSWLRWKYQFPVKKLKEPLNKDTEVWCRATTVKGKQISKVKSSLTQHNHDYLFNDYHKVKIIK